MTMAATLKGKLTKALAPTRLEIVDESHRHRGHAGWREGGETHFRVEVVSDLFEGRSRVERQRLVYQALAEELRERVHALQLVTRTPAEDAATTAAR